MKKLTSIVLVFALIFSLNISVYAASGDLTAPVITSVNMDNPGVEVSAGDSVTVTVAIEDESDISGGLIAFTNGSASTTSVDFTYDSETQVGTFVVDIEESMAASRWELSSVAIRDAYDNEVAERAVNTELDFSDVYFDVVNAASDMTAPVITSVTMSEPGVEVSAGDSVTVTVTIEDESDIAGGLIAFTNGSASTTSVDFTYDSETKIGTFVVDVEESMAASRWELSSVAIRDAYDNEVEDRSARTKLDFSKVYFQVVDTIETDIEYSISCEDVRIEDGTLVIDYTYSTPEIDGAERFVDLKVKPDGKWSGFGLGNDVMSSAAIDKTGRFVCDFSSASLLLRNCPPGTSCDYYVSILCIESDDEIEVACSDTKTFVVPGTASELSDTGSVVIPANEILNNKTYRWIKYTATVAGQATFTFEGNGGELTLFNADGRSIKKDTFLANESSSLILSTDLSGGETIYLRCRVNTTDTNYNVSALLEHTLEKQLTINANGGAWDSSFTKPLSFTLVREYYNNGWGGRGYGLIEYFEYLSKNGYTLAGWNTAPDGSGVQFGIVDGISYSTFEDVDGDVTLYAQWLSVPSNPSVIFNSFYGSFDEENADANTCEIQILEVQSGPVIAPTVYREGYTLIGWCSSNDLNNWSLAKGGLEDFYFAGDAVSTDQNLVLYAQWIPDEFSKKAVIFYSNTPDVCYEDSTSAYEIFVGDHVVHLSNLLDIEREGYVLVGWNTTTDGTGTQFGILDKINVSEAFPEEKVITLYAQWEEINLPENYFVFVLHGETFDNGKSYLIVDRTEPFEIPVLDDKENAPFIGWKNSAGSWGPTHTHILLPGEQMSFSENAYLYPVYSVPFNGGYDGRWLFVDANGGYFDANADTLLDFDMSMWWQPYDDLETYNLRANQHLPTYLANLYRTGFTLIALNTKGDGTGTQYAIDENIPSTGLKTVLYAQWQKNNISDGDSGNGSGGTSSGGFSGGNSSNSTSTVTKNSDGSTTTTITDKTTGAVTETTKTLDGTTGTIVTDKNGNVTEVSAKVPASVAQDAEKAGEVVKLPVLVEAADDTGKAVEIKVDVPTDGAKVELPVANVTSGAVVVIVNKDGTEEIVKSSTVSEDGVVVMLAKDATVKIIDNSKDFSDVADGFWADDSINFVTAREIFGGTSATTFNPNGSMTRQAMWMVLARMSGEAPGNMIEAKDWALANGISDGSAPTDAVTRQQFVTMLWRWARSQGVDVSVGEDTNILSYTDAFGISEYAIFAMQWACGEGIVGGYVDGTLRSHITATRAHVATFIQRFYGNVVL